MSTSLKTQDWEKNYSKYRESLCNLTIDSIVFLKDCYCAIDKQQDISSYSFQIQALEDELCFRNTSLGKELS